MTLLRDLVLVKLAPVPPRQSGLIEAHALTPVPTFGKVVQIGPDVADVAVGDCVAFSPTKGDLIQIGALNHLMIPEADLDAVIERKDVA